MQSEATYGVEIQRAVARRATRAAMLLEDAGAIRIPVICHATVAHRELKSRTFYMQLAPLADMGMRVRYVSPVADAPERDRVTFVPISACTGRWRQLLQTPALLRTLLEQNADVYHVQDPELLPVAFALKLLCDKRVVFDSYEDFASMALHARTIPATLRPLVVKAVVQLQKAAAHVFDAVITADPLTLKRFARVGRSRKRVFYNLPNLDMFPAPGLCAKPYDIVYRGGISDRAGTWTLLEALRLLRARGRDTKTLLIGYFDDADVRAQLFRRIDALDLSANVRVEGRIEHASMARTLSQAKIGVSPLHDIPKFQRNIPVKIFEYWACGLPVVASDLAPIRPFFKTARAGLLHRAGDATSLAESLETLLSRPELALHMGACGRDAVEKRFNNCSEVRKLHRLFTEIAARP